MRKGNDPVYLSKTTALLVFAEIPLERHFQELVRVVAFPSLIPFLRGSQRPSGRRARPCIIVIFIIVIIVVIIAILVARNANIISTPIKAKNLLPLNNL